MRTLMLSAILLLLSSGCQALPISQKQSAEQTQRISGDVGEVKAIVNDLIPLVIGDAAKDILFYAVAGLVGMYWIRRHSYLRQKPLWEGLKNGKCP